MLIRSNHYIVIETKEDVQKFYSEYMKRKLFTNDNKLKISLKDCIFQNPEKTKLLLEKH